jgi:hypothetical protein
MACSGTALPFTMPIYSQFTSPVTNYKSNPTLHAVISLLQVSWLKFCKHFLRLARSTHLSHISLIYFCLFNEDVSSSDHMALNDSKGHGRMRSWPNLRHNPSIRPEGVRKNQKNSESGRPASELISEPGLPKTKQNCQQRWRDIRWTWQYRVSLQKVYILSSPIS